MPIPFSEEKKDDMRAVISVTEMIKLMQNTYCDINITIANEFARIVDRFGIDVWEAIGIANKHLRVKILNPGPGVGGHCTSVDPWFLVGAAPDLTSLIRTACLVIEAVKVWGSDKWAEAGFEVHILGIGNMRPVLTI